MNSKNTTPLVLTLFAVLTAVGFSACVHDPFVVEEEGTGGSNPPIVEDPCDPDSVYYVNDIQPLIASNCAYEGCHGNGSAEEGVDLDTYESTIATSEINPGNASSSDFYQVLVVTDPNDMMPPPDDGGPLTNEQIDLIQTWINQGALNNSCEGCGNTDTVTWTETIWPLVQNNCEGCHSGSDPDAGIVLETYSEVLFYTEDGSFLGSIEGSPYFTDMPYESDPLMDCQIEQIQQWIADGAPEN